MDSKIYYGSHDTMTYLPAKKWWLTPFKFMAQCQSRSLREQYECGARVFDIRIVYEDFNYCFAHGLMTFKGDVWKTLEEMNSLGEKVYCRVLCERDENHLEFARFCELAQAKFPNIVFFGGQNKKDWKVLYSFMTAAPKIVDKYASWNNDTKLGTGWHLDDWFPRLYAMCFNRYWRKKLASTDHYLMQDFIGAY